jgi:hypothetical protein
VTSKSGAKNRMNAQVGGEEPEWIARTGKGRRSVNYRLFGSERQLRRSAIPREFHPSFTPTL